MKYPKYFIETVKNTWGENGTRWLARLPDLIHFFQAKWNLKDLQLSQHLSHSLILFASQNNSPVVLKLALPGKDFEHEVRILKIYDGHGVVKILDFELDKGGMLLEAILPGTHLKKLFPDHDDQAISIAVNVMNKIHAIDCKTSNLPTIELWLEALRSNYTNIPDELIKRARRLASELISTQASPVLLHGDLHHDNILKNGDDWTSIDPKGVIGEPVYEVGAFIRNPIPDLFHRKDMNKIISQRLDHFSAILKVDRQRIIDWSFVQAILAACWACEDNMPVWKQMIQFAEVIKSL